MDYILGLDLGVASLGWTVLLCDENGEPAGFAEWVSKEGEVRPALGVRIFDAGVESEKLSNVDLNELKELGKGTLSPVEKAMLVGKNKSNAKDRRTARGMKRQHFRQSQRRGRQFRALVEVGLLPKPPADSRKARHERMLALDSELRKKWCEKGNLLDQQTWIYRLRAGAVEGPLEAFEVGRALYQLGHRRGFRSNRKTDPRSAEEKDNVGERKPRKRKADAEHAVKVDAPKQSRAEGDDEAKKLEGMLKQIKDLGEELKASGKTLGAYMATWNPMERRIRGKFTGRQMYLDEFKAILQKQGEYHACLRDQATINAIYKAIFGQRGLKSSRRLIGRCAMEPGKVRALNALPIAQEFRMLQKINDLEVVTPDGKTSRPLNDGERGRIWAAMEGQANISFNALRDLLDDAPPGNRWEKGKWDDAGQWVVDKRGKEARLVERGWTFNFEPQTDDGGKEGLPGNRTMTKLRPIFPHWETLSQATKDEIVFMLDSAERPETVERIAARKREAWGLDDAGIQALRKVHLEPGRAAFSRLALEKLTTKMKEKVTVDGVERYRRYQEAKGAAYRKVGEAPVEDYLPPVLLSARHPKRWEETGERMMDPRIAVRNPAVLRVLTEMRKVVNAIIRRCGSKPRLIRIESGKELAKGRMEREKLWHDNLKRRKKIDGIVFAAGGDPKNPFDREKILLADECEWTCPYSGETITPHKLFALDRFAVEHIIPLSRSLDNTMRNKTLCRHDWNQRKNNRTPWEAFHGTSEWDNMLVWVRDHFHGRQAKLKAKLFQMQPKEVAAEYKGKFTERHLRDMQFAAKAARKYLSLLYGDRSEDGYSPKVQAVSGGMTGHLRRAWGLEGVVPSLSDCPTIPKKNEDGESKKENGGAEPRTEKKFRSDHRHHALDAAVVAMTTPAEIKRMADEIRRKELTRTFTEPVRFPEKMTPQLGANCKALLKERLEQVIVSHREDRRVGGKIHDATLYPRRQVKTNAIGRKVRGVDERFVRFQNNHHAVIVQEAPAKMSYHLVRRFEAYQRLASKPPKPVVQNEWPLGAEPKMVLYKGDVLILDEDRTRPFVIRSISGQETKLKSGKSVWRPDIELKPHNDARTDEQVEDSERKTFRISGLGTLTERHAKKVTITPLGEIVYVRD